jgi:hypothetical protein
MKKKIWQNLVCTPLGLEFMAQVSKKCVRNFHAKIHVNKMYIKGYVFIFYIFGFLPKYLCIITYACEKSKWNKFK